MPQPRLFLDADGVLADFDRGACELLGLKPKAFIARYGRGPFWKRLASSYPASVLNGYVANHPATAQRIAAIDRATAEVKAKQSAKKPLVP